MESAPPETATAIAAFGETNSLISCSKSSWEIAASGDLVTGLGPCCRSIRGKPGGCVHPQLDP